MAQQLKLSVKIIVENAMAAKLELVEGSLGAHVGVAFDDYLTKWENKISSVESNAIHEQLLALGFRW